MKVFLVALRRSGTTAFFDLMRQDSRFVSYDEPFNGMLRDLPGGNEWGTHDEFVTLFHHDPKKFWSLFRPISGISEISSELTSLQRDYLRYIVDSAENVFIDFTRCNFKIEELKKIAPDAILIHLYRSPASVASSHLLPSIWKHGRKFKYFRARKKFWKVQKKYDFWGFETIIGRHSQSSCARQFKELGIDPDEIYALPAVARLLAFWRLNYERVEADGAQFFGDNFLSVSFEDFCEAPSPVMAKLYEKLEDTAPEFDFSKIHHASLPAFPDHQNWLKFKDKVGLTNHPGDRQG